MSRKLTTLFSVLLALSPEVAMSACPAVLDFVKRPLNEEQPVNLCEAYTGKVLIIVNTASKCGFTPQFEALEALHEKYKDRGLVVLGFPSNDFGGQDPGSEQQIAEFCRLTYGVKFPMFEKTHAAEDNADPLYRALAKATGDYPQWNFHKYLIDRSGNVVGSFGSRTRPDSEDFVAKLEALLSKP